MIRQSVATTILVVVFSILMGFVAIGVLDAVTTTDQGPRVTRVPQAITPADAPKPSRPVERSSDDPASGALPSASAPSGPVEVTEPTESAPPFDTSTVPPTEPTPEPPVATATPVREGPAQLTTDVQSWAAQFSAAHVNGDVDYLENTLNPAVADAYGRDICAAYIAQTVGSIHSVRILNVDDPAPYVLGSPVGDLKFDNAVEVVARWTVAQTGEEAVTEFHLVRGDAGFTWLTTCGQKPPERA